MKTQGLALVAFVALVGCKGNGAADSGAARGPDLAAIPTGSGWRCSADYAERTVTRTQCFRSLAPCDEAIDDARRRFNADQYQLAAEQEAARALSRAPFRASDLTVARRGNEPAEPRRELPTALACNEQSEAHCMTWRDVAMNVTRFYCGASAAQCEARLRSLEADNQASTSVVRHRDLSTCALVR
jgi:hypothetical protein